MIRDDEIKEETLAQHKTSQREKIIDDLVFERIENLHHNREISKLKDEVTKWRTWTYILAAICLIVVVFVVLKNLGVDIGGSCPYVLAGCD